MEAHLHALLTWLSIPTVGLPALWLIAFISATLLPMGSEPAVFAYIKLAPDMFWAAILVATFGNTLGGMFSWWMGYVARKTKEKLLQGEPKRRTLIIHWLNRFGPKTLLLSWLPGIGDPICALAGWALLPWKPCLIYMAIGKLVRYICLTIFLLWVPDQFWQEIWAYLLKLIGF